MSNKKPMTKNLKSLVAEIKKVAQTPFMDDSPPSGGGAYTGPGSANVTPNIIGPIKNMQKVMQDFANTVVLYSARKIPGKTPNELDVDENKKHFNDFITEQYLTGSDIKGEEYTPDEKRVTQEAKQPTELIEMNIILNGLKRIGSQQSELLADNYWDFRTNNALKNIYAFAYALVELSKDFGRTTVRSFNENDLAKMRELIPADRDPKDLPPASKISRAKQLTPIIRKLTEFYQYYVNNIAMHPAWTRYIAGNDKMMTLQRGGVDPTVLNADEQKMMRSPDQYMITAVTPIGTTNILLSYLQNVNTLRALMEQMGVPRNSTNDPRVQKEFIDSIIQNIDNVLNVMSSKSSVPPTTSQIG